MFKKLSLALFIGILPLGTNRATFKKNSAFDIDVSRRRCGLPHKNEVIHAIKTPRGFKTADEMKTLAARIYNSSKRLANRTWYDFEHQKFYAYYNNEQIEIPIRLIKSVTAHIETALAMGYAKNIIFSDMGHAHMLIPLSVYNRVHNSMEMTKLISFFYNHPQTKFLYHTAEQLKMLNDNNELLSDRYLQQRFYTRNLVTDNSGSSEIHLAQATNERSYYNTVGSWPKHRYITGFDISANKRGCFPYFDPNGNRRYFDLSPMGHFPIGHHPFIQMALRDL